MNTSHGWRAVLSGCSTFHRRLGQRPPWLHSWCGGSLLLTLNDIFKRNLLNEDICVLMQITLKFVPRGLIDSNLSLVPAMAWRRIGGKQLPEPVTICSDLMLLLIHWYGQLSFGDTCQIWMKFKGLVTLACSCYISDPSTPDQTAVPSLSLIMELDRCRSVVWSRVPGWAPCLKSFYDGNRNAMVANTFKFATQSKIDRARHKRNNHRSAWHM